MKITISSTAHNILNTAGNYYIQLNIIHQGNTQILLNGYKGASDKINSKLFETVVEFIEKTERFN